MTDTQPIAEGDWLAPVYAPQEHAAASALVHIPGSKSLTNRYLLLAALADSPSLLRSPLHSRDSALMIEALRALGAVIEEVPGASPFGPDLRVIPCDFSSTELRKARIETGLAGTVMRFVPALAALLPGTFEFDGDEHAYARPMGALLDGLRQLGVSFSPADASSLPFEMVSAGLAVQSADEPALVRIDASASSQFVSALLLAAPRLPQGIVLEHVGSSVPSIPHIEMSVEALRELGVRVESTIDREAGVFSWRVFPGAFSGFEKTIEPDLSNAGPFVAAAMVTGTSVSVADWPAPAADGSAGTTQVGDHWRQLLPLLGGKVSFAPDSADSSIGVLTVTGPADITAVPGIDVDVRAAGELAPTLAAICSLAASGSQLRGIEHLRGHETDRLAALTAEINRLGGSAEETEDGIRILSGIPTGQAERVLARTYADHRMATFAAIIGLRRTNTVVENVATTSKTIPDFTGLWQALLDQLQHTSTTKDEA